MVNIQSWNGNTKIMEFSEDRLNVIIGKNETGKSVLFKVFRQMCFPTFFGRTGRKDLITTGKEVGSLGLILSNGTAITFIIHKSFQIYKMKTKDDTDYRVWKQDSLPEEIRLELGWYIDEENKILLNIVDNEQGLAFVDTTATWFWEVH